MCASVFFMACFLQQYVTVRGADCKNRHVQRGAAKAAETRRRKQNAILATTTTEPDDEYYCGICQALYGDSDEVEYWVGCGKCDTWFHGTSINISQDNEPDEYYCSACV